MANFNFLYFFSYNKKMSEAIIKNWRLRGINKIPVKINERNVDITLDEFLFIYGPELSMLDSGLSEFVFEVVRTNQLKKALKERRTYCL